MADAMDYLYTFGVIITILLGFVLGFLIGGASELQVRQWSRERKKRMAKDAVAQLERIEREYSDNKAERDSRAGGALCGMLMIEGYGEVVDTYERVRGL